MFSPSALIRQTAVAFGNNNFELGVQTKSIATMDQAEKVGLANKIVDGDISSGDLEKLCADPDFTGEFLNNVEVQPILLTAILQGKDIGDVVIKAMKEPTCTPCIEPGAQASVMSYVSHWLPVLQDQPEMTFAIKFFQDSASQQAIMDAIGIESIKNAINTGVIDKMNHFYIPAFEYGEQLVQSSISILQKESDKLMVDIKISNADISSRKAQLSQMDPSDEEMVKSKDKLDADTATHKRQCSELDKITNKLMKLSFELMFFNRLISQFDPVAKSQV